MTLDLKIPPLLVVLIIAALMWLAPWVVPGWYFEFPARRMIAGAVAAVGAIVMLWGVASFRLAGTTVNPMKPSSTSALVTAGVYGFTRNPMYLGFLFLLLAWAVVLSNAASIVGLPLFVLYMNRFQIEPEERVLASLFGKQYVRYASRVRRWL
jgi:protein-S-isoprenylcysteine O-methyltransferase Ste14